MTALACKLAAGLLSAVTVRCVCMCVCAPYLPQLGFVALRVSVVAQTDEDLFNKKKGITGTDAREAEWIAHPFCPIPWSTCYSEMVVVDVLGIMVMDVLGMSNAIPGVPKSALCR